MQALAKAETTLQIALNGNSTLPYPFLMDVRIARETGHDGVIVVVDKLRKYLSEGFSLAEARAALAGLPVLGLSNVRDIERASKDGRARLLAECEESCRLAEAIGCSSIQLLTGPADPTGPYRDPLGMTLTDLRRETTANLKLIAAIGHQFHVDFYLEPLAWTPLSALSDVLRVLDDAGQENVGLAIDFWHLWSVGTDPGDVARIEGKIIRSIDVCDAIGPAGTLAGADQRGRRVWPGDGAIPLQVWVDAVRATGFNGTWSCELYSSRHWQLDPWRTAQDLRQVLSDLLN